MTLVAGIDSSTQATKVTVRDLETGRVLRAASSPHPLDTVVDPAAWWSALLDAVARVGGLDDVAALSVSGQQHTPVFLDVAGDVVCPSPLWNDTGSHRHMLDLNAEIGRDEWIRRTGLPLTVSDTVTKVRWLRDEHPDAASRTAAVAVVHDWLTWRLRGFGDDGDGGIDELLTDRSEASGTAYWSGEDERYCLDLFTLAFGREAVLPRVLAPADRAGRVGRGIPGIPEGIAVGIGSGDNAAAALALGLADGDAVMSLGTSGVVYTRSRHPVHDYAGYVCSYADATGDHLPLVATLNAARNFALGADLLGVDFEELAALALQAPSGAEGLTLLPFFQGERTPDLPHARATLHGGSATNFTRSNFARAVVEGTLAAQVAMLDALADAEVPVRRMLLIGGAAKNRAVRAVLPQMVTVPVAVPESDEYVARGAALQAALALDGVLPQWPVARDDLPAADHAPHIGAQHAAAKVELGFG